MYNVVELFASLPQYMQELPTLLAVAPEQEEKEQEGLAPSIVSKPKAQVAEEGETIHFECSVVASPAPEVRCLPFYS